MLAPVNPEKVTVPEAVMAAIFTKFPEASILCVPAVAPVLMPVVPLMVVPVMVFAVEIVPNPEAILPPVRAPVEVREELITPEPKVLLDKTVVPAI